MNKKTISRVAVLAALAASCGQIPSFGQTILTGEIAGQIKDPTGGVVPNADVTAKSDATGDARQVNSNAAGEYRLPLLKPGSYTISVNSKGFQPAQVKATASLGQVSTLDITLSLATQSQTVQVSEIAEPLLQSENANVASTLDLSQLQNLPVGGSDMVAYAYSVPGVTMSTGAGYGNFTAFGLPATSNMFTINGTDYMDPYLNVNNSGASNLSLGANEVQEAAVITNAYTGQYGRQSGAQVNYVTKSGANAFHGDAIWNWNGNKLNANDFFSVAAGNPTPHEVSNQWAALVSGPIKKDKLFFLWDYEGLRYVLPNAGPIYIPTTAFANATIANLQATNPTAVPFYNTMFNLYNNATGVARSVPVTASTDSALGCGDLAGTIPGGFGTTVPCARTFESSVNNLNTEWLSGERIDYNVSSKDHLYFRAWTDRGVQATGTDAINSAFNANSVQPQWSTQLGYTRVISSNAVNELNLSGFYYSAKFGPPDLPKALATFPTTAIFGDGLYSQLGGGANPSATGDNNYPSGRKVSQWQIIDDYAYTHGRHEFRMGVNFRRNDVGDYAYGPNTSGSLTINSMTDFFNGNFNTGAGSFYSQAFTRIGAEHIGLYSVGVYGQDQWKVTPNFTLTLALRFEGAENPSCGRNCFDRPLTSFAEVSHTATVPYNSTIALGLSNAFKNLHNIVPQPRVGFAWNVAPKTVIRGGVGLFADQFQGNLASRFFTNAPNVATFTATSGIIAPGVPGSVFGAVAASNAAFQSGFASGATLSQLQASVPGFTLPALYTQADNFYVPTYIEWNLEVQREITHAVTVSANYVGNHGYHEYNQNPFLNAYSPAGFLGLPTTVPDTRFGEINELSSTGYSNYDGLATSVKWRVKSLVGSASYTWSHDLDTCSNNCLGRFNLATSPSLRYNISPVGAIGNYGNADYDVRHVFTANYLWTVPTHFSNAVLKVALGGWAVGGTFMAHSGYPFSPIDSALRSSNIKNSSGVATISVFPGFRGGAVGSCNNPGIACLNASQFTTASSTLDHIGRNAFRGPGYFDTDLTINKNLAATERMKFIIGASMYNVLNHPNFDLPVSNLAAGNFGQIISTVAPASSAYGAFQGSAVSGRVVVMNAKFLF